MARTAIAALCVLLLAVTVVLWVWNGHVDWPQVIARKWMANREKIDCDFSATIQRTKEPYVFIVTVNKVYASRKALICRWAGIQYGFTLRNSRGAEIKGRPGNPAYGEELGNGYSNWPPKDAATVTAKVRMVTKAIPPGTYTILPDVRIMESGDERLSGMYKDFGSVAVPAGNSVTVTVKK